MYRRNRFRKVKRKLFGHPGFTRKDLGKTAGRAVLIIILLSLVMPMLPERTNIWLVAADEIVGTHATLKSAIDKAPTDGISTGTEFVIEITSDITLTAQLAISTGKNIVFRSGVGGPIR